MFGIGRLHAGVEVEQARAELTTLWNGLERQYPRENGPYRVTVLRLQDHLVNEDSRPFVVLLVAVAGFVLLIGCANVANLQLARAAGRRREIALRRARGAGRWRIMRQLLTESVVLATAGGALGLLLAVWGVNLLRTTMPPELAWICDLESLHLDVRALLFTFMLVVAAGVLSGLAPAWQNSRAELNDALKEGNGRATSGQGHRLRQAFVVAEVALALILLIGAGLMVKGFATLATPSPEIEARNLLTFTVTLPVSKYREAYQVRAFYTQALEKIQALPEARSGAMITGLPYSFYDNTVSVSIEGQVPVAANQLPIAMQESISRGYLRTMHIALRQGRDFDERDTADSPAVAVISDTMARSLWPGDTAIGRRMKLGAPSDSGPWITIVGVAGDTRHEVYDRSFRSVLYRPFQQDPPHSADFALRTQGDPGRLSGAVRAALIQVDRTRPVERIESMQENVRRQASGLQYIAGLMAVFGLAALVLAAVGVYGVMAYSVNERRREIGIRMALGASRAAVLQAVMARGIALTVGGLSIGTPIALVLARFVSSLIYGVNAWDVATFIGVPSALAAIALSASYIPALRATRIDPLVALHYE